MIEERFASLETTVNGLGTKVERLGTRVERLEAKVDGLDTKVDGLSTRVDGLSTKVDGLCTKFNGLDTKFDDLGRQMRLLHEDVIGRIADLAPDFAPIRREFKEADAKLRESIERRLEPLEAAERSRQRST